ncbi:hypothetical protein FJR48_08020 [Sulfurimonas lithotrophica]|uniref:Periplasmic nitrate reductase component NapL n=1 Tax=Sulfurimonas lithotrophica TaxID=2590022 RepID=A0A5P8P231_9BACT|nr:hypothetical protein [Sulfurimonas lithotrophica]QFR49681.1 hypothetical protein FJR48_08020 [Sulfurimonas lithotrophica]
MKVLLFIVLLFTLNILAKNITPYKYVKASEAVSNFVKVGDILVIGTEEGIVDIYDLKKDKLIDQIMLSKHKNILGDNIRSLVVSVDYLNGKIIFVIRLLSTWREFYVYENKKLTRLIDESQHIALQKVKFIDENTVLISTMDNAFMLYDLKTKKFLYKKQLNLASFSDYALSEDKKYFFTADETPQISKIEVKTGKTLAVYNEANKRDIFSVDYKNKTLISGGKDKRVILYKSPSSHKMTKGKFFVYAVALSPDASKAAFVKNENSEISVIDTTTLQELYLLKGHKQTIIDINFYKNDELISSDEDNRLFFWKLE